MATTQIDGGKQIRSGTITNTEIASSAAIADTKLATSYVKADGTRAFTGDQSHGGFKITSLGDGVADTDAATLGQLRAAMAAGVKAGTELAADGADKITDMIPGTLDDKIIDPIVGSIITEFRKRFGL